MCVSVCVCVCVRERESEREREKEEENTYVKEYKQIFMNTYKEMWIIPGVRIHMCIGVCFRRII